MKWHNVGWTLVRQRGNELPPTEDEMLPPENGKETWQIKKK